MKPRLKNGFVILIFFTAGIFSLNLIGDSLINHALGVLFLIVATYGFVAVSKRKQFLFNK